MKKWSIWVKFGLILSLISIIASILLVVNDSTRTLNVRVFSDDATPAIFMFLPGLGISLQLLFLGYPRSIILILSIGILLNALIYFTLGSILGAIFDRSRGTPKVNPKNAPKGIKIISWLCYLSILIPIITCFNFLLEINTVPSFLLNSQFYLLWTVSVILEFLLAFAAMFTARGLLRGEKWSRTVAVLVSIIEIIFTLVMHYFLIKSIVTIVLFACIVIYLLLNKKVKGYFLT